MKTRWYHQLLSVVLVLALLVQLLPLNVLAASSTSADSTVNTPTNSFTESEQLPATIIGEEESLRTETEKHFRLSDGSFIAVSYGLPVHYQDDEGNWQDIDNTLSLSNNRSAYSSANSQVATTFAANLSSGQLLTSENGDVSITMSLLNSSQLHSMSQTATTTTQQMQLQSVPTIDTTVEATLVSGTNVLELPVTDDATGSGWTVEELIPEKLQSSVLYEDVYPGVDLLYTAYSHNVKEQIIVNQAQSTYRYNFLLQLDGLTAELNADNSISLIDGEGSVRYTIPAPYMEDYNGATSAAVTYTLAQTTGGTVLTVEADAAWINAEDRVFPVTIDPTLEVDAGNSNDDIYATYVVEGTPDTTQATYQHLYFGYGYNETVKEQRIFMHFNTLPALPAGATVVDAQLSMYMFRITYLGCSDLGAGIYEVTDSKPSTYSSYRSWIGSLSWNTQPIYDTGNMIDYAVIDGNPDDGQLHKYYNWDMTEMVQKWYEEETENRTIAMAITRAETTYGTSYCSVPVFMAYGETYPPLMIVSYRNNTGIEDHYSYATLGAGSAGTAYISDFTGQLTVVKGLVSYSSTINPFALSLVYNSFASDSSPAENLGYAMSMGRGWKLDVMQKIEAVTIGGTAYLKYHDGDGTIHYFQKNAENSDDNTYYDEDGLGLSIVQSNENTYTLTDMQDNTYAFTNGMLTGIQDNNGNQYIVHVVGGRITSIGQKNNGATAETAVATFAYTDGILTSVTDAAGIVYTLGYTNDNLTSITMGDTQIAEYHYNGYLFAGMTDTESGYSLGFATEGDGKVYGYGEMDKDSKHGAEVSITYDGSDKTTYQDYGNDRAKGTADDIFTYCLFDNSGRTVNAYSTDAEGKIVGASNAIYFNGGEIDRRNNRTIRTATIGVAAEQELLNSGFEDTSSNKWSGTVSTTKPRTGAYSLETVAVSGNGVCASKESRMLYAGTTYTFSGYVNTTQITTVFRGGVYLMVEDAGENIWCSDYLDYRTSENVDDGWVRISVTFTAKVTGAHTVSVCCAGAIGTFYVDDVQLERGNAPSNKNLIENGNMQAGTYGWTLGDGSHPTTSYGMYRKDDSLMAMSIHSSPCNTNTKVSQEVPINLAGVDTYVLSGWAMGNAVPDNVTTAEDYAQDVEKSFGLRATINYADETKEYFYAPFDSEVSDWQFTSLAIVPSDTTKTIDTITVECVYEKNGNTAHFDNISLVRETVQSMRYDDDGNLVATSTTGVASDTNTYENGNLIETVTDSGSTYTYTYDETYAHRLLSATDGSVTMSMAYDNYGNVTSSATATNTGTGLRLETASSYSSSGNLLLSSSDTNNILTQYQYSTAVSQMLGMPTYVTDANNTVTSLAYDDFGRTTQMSVANHVSLNYNYDSGNLKSIDREGNNGKKLNYIMYYDTFGNMTAFTVNDNPLMLYEYGNKNGQLTKQTYCNENSDSISYTYDNLGRMATATYSDGRVVTYTYNGDGQLHSVKETGGDSPATYLYTYDAVGNLITSEKKDEAGDSLLRVHQNYDSSGQLVGQTWYAGNSSHSESYTYTTDGLLNTMVTATGETLQFSYDDLQRLTSAGNGLYTKNYSYRNLSGTRTTAQVSQVQYAGLPSTLTYGYTYDAIGNIATYSAPGKGIVTYTYDALGQLLSAVGDETYTYTYDSAGNILTANGHTYTYGAAGWPDLLTAFDGETITYDGIANPLSYYNGTRWTFTWENGRSLATATDGTTDISYTYDANGLRTTKTAGGSTHYYYYASGQLLRDYVITETGTSTATTQTLDFFYDANGYPYALKCGSSIYYYITNLQGDVMHLVDAEGNTVASYEYDPYGNIISATGSMADVNPLRYRGYYYDSELEMYYLQSRYYDPQIGRFINADDVSLLGGSGTVLGYNLFAYCENNPIINADYFGYAKINIKWVALTVDIIIWFIPVFFSIAKTWSTVSKSAAKLVSFGNKLVSAGKKLLKKLDDRIYCAFAKESSYLLAKTIGKLAGIITVVSSIGAMVQYIIDVLDGKWDGYLNTSKLGFKLDFTKDY